MKPTVLSILAGALTATCAAQLAPTTPAPMSAHLLEVNKEWRTMDRSPVDGERIVRFENEAQRIAEHLHRVAAFLRAHSPEGLPASALGNRLGLLDALDAYADRGLFPQNNVLPYRNPVFIDPRGTACAVGQLMIASDARPLAERISAGMNLAYVHDMHRADVDAWAVTHGFTENELAWIQPAYAPNQDWYALGGGTDGEVTTLLTLSNGDLLVAGEFTDAGGTACTRVARWTGSAYQAMGSGVDGLVTCAIESSGEIYLGGSFNSGFQDLAYWTGTSWTYENAFSGKYVQVNDLHVFNGELHAAGYAMGFAGASHMVLKKNGSYWDPVGSAFDNTVRSLEVHDGELIAGGDFTSMISPGMMFVLRVARFVGGDWYQVADGLNAPVYDLHEFNSDLYAGGDARVDSLPTFGFAKLGAGAISWEMEMPNQTDYLYYLDNACRITSIIDANDEIFLGGYFGINTWMSYGSGVMRWTGVADMFVAYAMTDQGVNALAHLPGILIMGGGFQNNSLSVVPYVGYTDISTGIGETWSSIAIGLSPNPVVNELIVQLPKLIGADATLEVIDASGRTVIAPRPVSEDQVTIDVTALANGSYSVRVKTGGTAGIATFIKR